jgi:cytochrome c-type biogenesis protein CcmH/NrfG
MGEFRSSWIEIPVMTRVGGARKAAVWVLCVGLLALGTGSVFAQSSGPANVAPNNPVWVAAKELYDRTEYTQAIAFLEGKAVKDAPSIQLLGQAYFMNGDYKKASDVLERAAIAAPTSSDAAMWLGRAFGRRAETSSPFTAPGFASKSRQMLEKAVMLDPGNREALGDLFDYYLEAPGFLGGGEPKAEALAAKVAKQDPAEGHYYQALLADRRKQYDNAEQHFRDALELAPKQVGRFLDLAKFLATRGKTSESEALFDQAAKVAPEEPRVLFERASLYIKEHRKLGEARKLLEQYLKSPLKPNDPSRHDAEELLKKTGA